MDITMYLLAISLTGLLQYAYGLCPAGEELCVDHFNGRRTVCFDSEHDFCCSGEVLSRSPHLGCCLPLSLKEVEHAPSFIYNQSSVICCGGIIYDNVNGDKACCDGNVYDKTVEICCNDIIYNTEDADACCGDQAYEKSKSLCCEGGDKFTVTPYDENRSYICCEDGTVVDARVDTCKEYAIKTCKHLQYNIADELCCEGILHERVSGYQHCCGNATYDERKETCCYGTYKILTYSDYNDPSTGETYKVKQECCRHQQHGGFIIASETICCDGFPFPDLSSRLRCCGNTTFDITEEQCCAGRVINKSEQTCCGDDILDINNGENKVCCSGHWIMDPDKYVCCPKSGPLLRRNKHRDACCEHNKDRKRTRLYDSSIDKCVGGRVHRKWSKLCGNRHYNPEKSLCCNGVIRSNPNGEKKCCGFFPYHPEYETCCNGHKSYGPQKNAICHGRKAIHITENCDNGFKQCAGLCYDPANSYCCSEAGFVRRFHDGHTPSCPCGTRGHYGHIKISGHYNPMEERCDATKGKVVRRNLCITSLTSHREFDKFVGIAYTGQIKTSMKKGKLRLRLHKIHPIKQIADYLQDNNYNKIKNVRVPVISCDKSIIKQGRYVVIKPHNASMKAAFILPYSRRTVRKIIQKTLGN